NLIENAIKFSEDDCTIEIVLKTHDGKIVFSVKDCGMGIPNDLHKKVFMPYYQITNEKKSIQGMGLGLPIVKKIIENLNAAIKIENNSGTQGGITILVILNQYKKSETEIALKNTPRKKILISFEEIKEYTDVVEPGRQSILLVE